MSTSSSVVTSKDHRPDDHRPAGQPLSSGPETYFERHPRRVTSALNALGVSLWESEVGTTSLDLSASRYAASRR